MPGCGGKTATAIPHTPPDISAIAPLGRAAIRKFYTGAGARQDLGRCELGASGGPDGIPAAAEQVGSQIEHCLGPGLGPAHPRLLEPGPITRLQALSTVPLPVGWPLARNSAQRIRC